MSKRSYRSSPSSVLITNDIKVSHGNKYIYPKCTDVSCFLAVGRKIHLRSSILFPELELRDQSQYKTAVPPHMGIRDARAFYESEGHACLSNNQ